MAPERENSIDVPDHYQRIRRDSEALCEPLTVEDYGVQPMADASPPKWHLAHTSWFFETFLLKPYLAGYEVFHSRYEYLFNSYYNGIGNPYPRAARGLLSRPTVADIRAYRAHVDDHMAQLLATAEADGAGEVGAGTEEADTVKQRTTLGLHHERQHQELLLTDIKCNLGNNPLMPA
ncbi:MAG: DinB family protein, partial [Gammaproteobacteria bacterium]|nr:DinB family protein [Gammaproteobacteria bacterium]